MRRCVGQEVLYGQALELRDVDVLHLCALDQGPLVGDEIPHVEDGHGLVGAEIGSHLAAEEPPDLAFAGELGAEGLGCDLLGILLKDLLLVFHFQINAIIKRYVKNYNCRLAAHY